MPQAAGPLRPGLGLPSGLNRAELSGRALYRGASGRGDHPGIYQPLGIRRILEFRATPKNPQGRWVRR